MIVRLAALLITTASASAFAQGKLALSLESFAVEERKQANAVVRVTNGTGKTYAVVFVSCAFIAKGRALATSSGVVENLAPGESGFTTVHARAQAEEAKCRISSTDP